MLTEALLDGDQFIHAKFGDGAIRVMHGACPYGSRSADGEPMWDSADLAAEHFRWIWAQLAGAAVDGTVYMGDWNTCSDPEGLERTWQKMCGSHEFDYLAYEALLIHRYSPALLKLYLTIRSLKRRKILVTSQQNSRAANILQAMPLYIPGPREYKESHEIAERTARIIAEARPLPELLLFAGGSVTAAVQAHLLEWSIPITQISIGSGLDPLMGRGRTRSGQIDCKSAEEYYRALL
jgi:hypothetical protein